MKPLNFVLVGVGGQGILLSSDILCLVGMMMGYDVKKTDVHGMAQRGGSVISHVRLADQVFSPVVPDGAADILLAFEKLEACRSVHYLHEKGAAVVNDQAIPTLALAATQTPYPSDDAIRDILNEHAEAVTLMAAGALAAELGNIRVANVILLGALSSYLDIPVDVWLQAVEERVPPKVRALNRQAFEVGRSYVANG
ncbi:MAG: indolepyruvate oxidoreductase subunit beta [Proteobacteria bacterium]|nr:indolepyruvate oxidoreductase subunit beta [Pseudomonadota bacterium]